MTGWQSRGAAADGRPVTPRLRPATAADAAAAADVLLRSRHANRHAIPPSIHPDDGVRTWFREVVLEHHEVWVAEVDSSDLVGVMVLADGWLEQLYLDPSWIGRGLGARFIEIAKRRYPHGLQLWTFASNKGAQRFYERHGFTAVERTDGDNEERAPDIRYVWQPG